MAPHLAEEILHFAKGGLKDPSIGEVNAGSIFEKGWSPIVSFISICVFEK